MFSPDFLERQKYTAPLRYYDKNHNPDGRVVYFSDAELIQEADVFEQLNWAKERFHQETRSELKSVVVGDKVWGKMKQRMVDMKYIESMQTPVSKIVNTGPHGPINFMGNYSGIDILMPIVFADE